ncbi:MAG: MgtC/SapB family protein [Steroidobacteraceae bacterium]
MEMFFDAFMNELSAGWPPAEQLARVSLRLLAAALFGAIIGIQREQAGKAAGVRTHMLVAMGSALFVIGPLEAEFSREGLSRVIQGIVTGIGFIGGGAILKLRDEREITGLTTAAGILMTSAVGVAAGLGLLGAALFGTVLTWIILAVILRIELQMSKRNKSTPGLKNE